MNEWKEVKLGDILNFISKGTTPPKGVGFVDKGINYVKSDAIGYDRKLDKTKIVQINEETHQKFKRSQLTENDILFSMAGIYLGKNAIVTKDILPANTNQALAILRLNQKEANPNYVSLYLSQQSMIDFINNMSGQSAQPNVNFEEIKSIEIKLPPLPEQTAIASVLSSLDDKIDLLHRQNATLEKMAETLFRQWFVEEAKEEWEMGKLGDLVESANTGLDAIRRAPIVENYTGIKCLRIQDISQSKPISNWGNSEVTDSDFKKAQLKKGDIIMARTCSPGILLHIQEDLPAVFNNGLARIRANKSNCHPLFLKYLFKTDLFINHIYGISDGTAVQLNMKLGDLLSFDLSIPPKVFLDSFIEIVKKWDDKILINQTQIRTLTALRDTLLPKLMSGEVRVEFSQNS